MAAALLPFPPPSPFLCAYALKARYHLVHQKWRGSSFETDQVLDRVLGSDDNRMATRLGSDDGRAAATAGWQRQRAAMTARWRRRPGRGWEVATVEAAMMTWMRAVPVMKDCYICIFYVYYMYI